LGYRGRWICARVAGEALDVGCAGGEVAEQLEREGHRIVTVEPERAGALPFEAESFDTVLLGAFIAEWASRERPIVEARRVLRPGGRLLVAVPYPAAGGDGGGISLEALLAELTEFAVKEIEAVEGQLCLLADRVVGRNRAAAWRRALEVSEECLVERNQVIDDLTASVTELEASREREERARGDVVRLETALAAATHQRDLEGEKARLASDGVTELERRLEGLRHEHERGLAEVDLRRKSIEEMQRELTETRQKLGESERKLVLHDLDLAARIRELSQAGEDLKTAQLGIESRERKLALSETRLEKARQRAEQFRGSLVAIREGRSYRLMRILWRLRRPFRRASREESVEAPAGEDADPAPPVTEASPSAPAPAGPPLAATERKPPMRPTGTRLRVVSILDEMSQACFAPDCELVPLSLKGWAEQLDETQPDLLLVESAWNANSGEWQYRIAQYPRADLAGLPALRALIDGCRERGIPTAFWNKEDPVHLDRFFEAAGLFDHVFTTDIGCVERYRALPGKRTVTPLPFAAQPRIHNPIAAVPERSASPCFAGAWYRDRHLDRRLALEALLDAARPYGLVIYDRRFGADDDAFGFPERFAPHVLGKLPYERILDVYKSHRVFLNANSVVDSATMCSRRVFELAACDTAIVSTPGAALAALLGEGMVEEAGDEASAAAALERLLGDEAERKRRTRTARRVVFTEHTYAERLAKIAEVAGLGASSLRREPFVVGGRSSNGNVPNGADPISNGPKDRHPWRLALTPGATLSESALADLAAGAAFADADVIGASPERNGDPAVEHRYVADLDPRALLLRRELVESRGCPSGSPEQVRAQLRQWSDEGIRLYAADADLLPSRKVPPVAIGAR